MAAWRHRMGSGLVYSSLCWSEISFQAERMSRAFVDQDRYFLRELATLYRNDIPLHENQPYVDRAKELRADMDAELLGVGNLYAARTDRGWSPPTPKDVAAEEQAAEDQRTEDAGSAPRTGDGATKPA